MFKGIYTALITPFQNDKIDLKSFQNLLEHQIENGVDGFVINGTTAESPNLSWQEVEDLFEKAKKVAPDKALIVGCGSNSTKQSIEKAKAAEKLKADALLLVVPYYNKPTQEGMYQHFKAIHDSTETPILLYNVPGRTVVSLNPETCHKLSNLDRVVGIKDATGDMEALEKESSLCNEDFSILSGEDATYVDFALNGGHGCISVLSHVIPKKMKEWHNKSIQNDKSPMADFKKYKRLCELLFKEPNPVPVKNALYQMGIIQSDDVRLPLVSISEKLKQELTEELKGLEII